MSPTVPDPTTNAPNMWESLRRYAVAVGIVTAFAAALGYQVSALTPPKYEATASYLLADPQDPAARSAEIERDVLQEGNRLRSRAVARRAAEELGGGLTADGVQQRIDVDVDIDASVLAVTARAGARTLAADLADAVLRAYEEETRAAIMAQAAVTISALRDQADGLLQEIVSLESGDDLDTTTRSRIELLRAQLVAVESRIGQTETDAALRASSIGVLEPALEPAAPVSPRPGRAALLAGAVGFVLSVALAHWRTAVLHSARPNAGRVLGAPLLAEIPAFDRSPAELMSRAPGYVAMSEAYQFLVTAVHHALTQSEARSILVTSALPGEGKSVTALRLAAALATQGRDVVLVDADIRARGLSTMLRRTVRPGLVEFADGCDMNDVIEPYRLPDGGQLRVISAGQTPKNPTGLLATGRYREAVAKITAYNELTVIDGAPLLVVADASAVAAQVGGVLLVVDARTPRKDLEQVRLRLELSSTPLLGYVLNRVADARRLEYPYASEAYPSPDGVVRRLLRRPT